MLLEPVDASDHGGLPGAGRTDDHDHLLPADPEVDVVQGAEVAEELVDPLQLDHHVAGPGDVRGVGEGLAHREPTPSFSSRR